jgi:ABC-type multidrug transport system fused ATPase/permease subunit
MTINNTDFYSLRNIRDNFLLISIGNEYLAENVYLAKFGKEIKKSLAHLRDDIKFLKKEFPGKFTSEVNTDVIMNSFDRTVEHMLSGKESVISECKSGKLGDSLGSDIKKVTEAIEKIWNQVKGSDIKYTTSDQISGFFGRLNLLSGVSRLITGVFRAALFIFVILLAIFSYLFFTMEKESPLLRENRELMSVIQDKKALLKEKEDTKKDAQLRLKSLNSRSLLREDKIAILDLETKIQVCNNEINIIEGQIESEYQKMDENNKKIEKIRAKSFIDRLLKR